MFVERDSFLECFLCIFAVTIIMIDKVIINIFETFIINIDKI